MADFIARTRLATIVGVGLALLVASAAAGAAGSAFIIGRANSAGTSETKLATRSGGAALGVTQSGPGWAVRGSTTNTSAYTFGVYGSTASTRGNGVGGIATAATGGIGVRGMAAGTAGIGVDGTATAASGTTYGVVGSSASMAGSGVSGFATSGSGATVGTSGSSSSSSGYGVVGYATAATPDAPHGIFGVYGISTVATSGPAYGVYGRTSSATGAGVAGENKSPGGLAGVFYGNVTINGALTVTGAKTGFVADYAVNGSAAPLHQGDAVTVLGVRAALVGDIPLVVVGPARAGDPMIGVADKKMIARAVQAPDRGSTEQIYRQAGAVIGPGDYLLVVTEGAYTVGLVDASAGSVRPGDPLAAGTSAGHLVLQHPITVNGVKFYAPGTAVGYALGELRAGSGLIAIFVSPH